MADVSQRATRACALARLGEFLEFVPTYASKRSYVAPGLTTVSRLAPFIRRRLITEHEVVSATLERHSFQVAEKFIQEVVWRTYWKGWLERNPGVWYSCLDLENRQRQSADDLDCCWGDEYRRAVLGQTRLSFFNEWVHELKESGYLHNHVRMWFASIWIFTLKIPWQLGAMFMYRNLLDGDPASNTLSWRWVAGLQTKGKRYVARADNIQTYSLGRWRPSPGDLAEEGFVIDEQGSGVVDATQLGSTTVLPQGEFGVLTTSDDLSSELDGGSIAQATPWALIRDPLQLGESELVKSFVRSAEDDVLERIGDVRGMDLVESAAVLDWASSRGLGKVLIVAPPVGANRAQVDRVVRALQERKIECLWYQREWDRELFSLADKGFFPFWERIKKRIVRGEPLFLGKKPQK